MLGPTVNKWERSRYSQAWRLFQDTLHEPLQLNKVVVREYVKMGPARYLKSSEYMVADHIEDTLSGSKVPTLIVRGQYDKIVPRAWTHFLQSRLLNAVVREMPKTPHIVQFTKPKELLLLCRDFLHS